MGDCRQIIGPIRFAEECDWPECIPRARNSSVRGAKAYGRRFERCVANLTGGIHGQWFHFADARGQGFCQTDVLLMLDGEVIILECKLTEVGEARKQLRTLYVPIISYVYKKPVKGIVVARHLTHETERGNVYPKLGLAMKVASANYYPTLHWIGKGPI